MRAGRMLGVVALLLAWVAPGVWGAGKPWSFADEVYHIYASGLNLQEMKSAGITLVSHVPCTKDYFEKAHALGIRVLPYVSLYKTVDLSQWPEGRVHPFWREVDCAKHPGWVLIRPDGKLRRPFNNPRYRRGAYQSCCNAPGIHEGYVRGIKAAMDLGADGVFVDNVHPWPKCHGVELGIRGHKHTHPDRNNAQMFKAALRKVYAAVKSYGPDKVVILNGGRAYGDCGDALMWESYICSHGRVGRHLSWPGVRAAARRWAGYLASGKGVDALVYLWKSPYGAIEDAYYTYACAKLSGFHWTASSGHYHATLFPHFGPGAADWSATTCYNGVLRVLYRVRLGNALGPMAQTDGVTYRLFERGLVAVNPHKRPLAAALPIPPQCREPSDLCRAAVVPARDGRFTATIPPESGRVYISRRAIAASFLEDARLCASEAARHIRERRVAAADLLTTLGQIETLARRASRSLDDLPAATRIAAQAVPLLHELRPPGKPEPRPEHPFNPETTVAEHLTTLRRAVPKALGILAGVELRVEARRDVPAGESEPVQLRLVAHGEALGTQPAALALELPPRWKAAEAEGTRQAHATAVRFTAPADATGRHFLGARADVRLADGTPICLYTGLQVVVQPAVRVEAAVVATRERGRAEVRVVVTSCLATPVRATIGIALPEGWEGQSLTRQLDLPARATRIATFPVRLPPAFTARQARIVSTVTLRPRDGKAKQCRTEHRVAVAPLLVARRVAQPPVLDGVLDEPCWKSAQTAGGFVHFETGEPVREQTVARVAWDGRHLHVAIDCRESQMRASRASIRPDDAAKAAKVLFDDCVAVYLDPAFTQQSCLRFFVNTLGARTRSAGIPFAAAASRRADGWSVELRFPFAGLAVTPKAGDLWGINFYRNQWRLREHSAWSCTHGPYSTPKRFGVLLFEDKTP